MAVTSINSLTKLRLTGLSSGMDTDAIIQNLMQIQQLKIDREYRAQTQLQWKQSALTGIKDELTSFRQNFLSVLGANSMVKESVYNAYSVSLAGKNADAVSVKGSVKASAGTVSIDQVKRLASGATATSNWTKDTSISGGIMDTNVALKDVKFAKELQFDNNGEISFSINGQSFTFSENDTLKDMMSTINSSGAATMSYDRLTDKFTITGSGAGLTIKNISGNAFGGDRAFGIAAATYAGNTATSTAAVSNGTTKVDLNANLSDSNFIRFQDFSQFSFSINGKSFTFKKEDNHTLQSVMDTVNNADIGVQMSYENGKFTIKSTDGSAFTIKDEIGTAFGANGAFGIDTGSYAAGASTNLFGTFNGPVDRTKPLDDSYFSDNDKLSFTISGEGFSETFEFDKGVTLQDVIDELEGRGFSADYDDAGRLVIKAPAGVEEFSFDQLEGTLGINSGIYGNNLGAIANDLTSSWTGQKDIFDDNGILSFNINGTNFTFNKADGDTLDDVIAAVNSANVGAKMDYDSSTGKFTVTDTSGYGFSMTTNQGSLGVKNGTYYGAGASAALSSDPTENINYDYSAFAFSINGEKFIFKKTDNVTLQGVIDRVNSSNAGVNMSYDALTDSILMSSKTAGKSITIENHWGNAFGNSTVNSGALGISSGVHSSGKIETGGVVAANDTNTALKDLRLSTPLQFETIGTDTSGNAIRGISFTINGKRFTFNENETLANMMSTINSSSAGVTMSYSSSSNQFSITTNETGSDQRLVIENHMGNAFGGVSNNGGAFGINTGTYSGEDAIVRINGSDVRQSSNTFTLDGLEYTLNRTTDEQDEAIRATVTRDVSEAVDKIKTFVDEYNKLIAKLDNLLVERKTTEEKGYTPLTDEEKAEMTEKQIEQWEAIAKKGLLRNDSGIQSLTNSLRQALYDSVSAAGLSPAQIGIKTGSYFDNTKGQITLDEDALRAALEKDPEKVMSVFANISESEDASTAYKENGLMFRIDNLMYEYINGSQSNSLESLERSLTAAANKISTLQRKMEDEMERYYLKFSTMETTLSEMQSQSDWLTSMLNGG